MKMCLEVDILNRDRRIVKNLHSHVVGSICCIPDRIYYQCLTLIIRSYYYFMYMSNLADCLSADLDLSA